MNTINIKKEHLLILSGLLLSLIVFSGFQIIKTLIVDSDFQRSLSAASSGCDGGLCSSLPVGFHIGYDWDGDGKNMTTGDCDETCPTCYKGSIGNTAAPDSKDQNCNGEVDEQVTSTPTKTCAGVNYVRKSAVDSACSSYCVARGSTMNNVSCSLTTNWYNSNTSYNFETCAASNPQDSGGNVQWCTNSQSIICNCNQTTRYY
jgi:hypothetical protein